MCVSVCVFRERERERESREREREREQRAEREDVIVSHISLGIVTVGSITMEEEGGRESRESRERG